MNEMYSKSFGAIFSAARLLFKGRRALGLMLASYAGLLAAVYLFVSTREATIFQLSLTLIVVFAAPALFFVFQTLTVSYPRGSVSGRKVTIDCLKLMVVSLPVIALTLLAVYGLSKLQSHLTVATTARYLVLAVIAPLLTIQLWIATSNSGLKSLLRSLRKVATETFAPGSVFVYACGFLIFAVGPYLLLLTTMPIQRPWLELSVLILRLSLSATLIFLGWATTVGALSILSRASYLPANKE
jgi:hypothetical protein